jgi:hypothetical protein
VKRGTCDRPVTISGEPRPPLGGRRLIAAQLRPLGYELASPRCPESRASQTYWSRVITRPICAAAYHAISSVASRFVHKSVHNTLRRPATGRSNCHQRRRSLRTSGLPGSTVMSSLRPLPYGLQSQAMWPWRGSGLRGRGRRRGRLLRVPAGRAAEAAAVRARRARGR